MFSNEGYGTPHLHLEVHIASAYQYGTINEVAKQLELGKFRFQEWLAYHEHLHTEDILDTTVKQEMEPKLEEDWHNRFAGREHDDMSVTPLFVVDDSQNTNRCHVGEHLDPASLGAHFKKKYSATAQRMFSRVQHHMHKKTKKGIFL